MHLAHIAIDSQTSQRRIQTCTEHARSVAALAKGYLSPMGLPATGELAGLLHDLGKFTEEFDTYLDKATRGEKVTKGSVIHTFAGVRYLLEQYHSKDGNLTFSDLASELIAVSIGSHHGLFDLWDERHQNGFEHRLNHQPAYDHRAIEAFFTECCSADEISLLYKQAEQEICQFYMQKIGTSVQSNDEVPFALSLLIRLITSAVVDADRTDTRCFMENLPLPANALPSWDACAEKVNAYIGSFPLGTPIQQARRDFSVSCAAAAEQPPGLYRLDLPTGGGKTLAALRFAVLHSKKHHMRRVFYVAPLLSIIEQNAAVIRRAVGGSLPVLEHHSNIIREHMSADELKQTELLQENWDAPIIVTTLVQLLETLFSGKMASVRRFHCLSNSVIIFDEVQSLPPKMLSLFNCAVNFLTKCCGTTVVLCSATQPAFDNRNVQHKMLPSQRLISEELFNRHAPLFRRTTITDAGSCNLDELAVMALSTLETSSSLLVVCNTKRESTDLYSRLAEQSDAQLFHLSAGMCMAHRKQVLAKMNDTLQAGKKLVCVSTQVIEAGVDVSFGAVIRLSAGLDNIVQAAGRCNRHGEHDTPQPVRICHLKDEKLGPLREIRESQNALSALLAEFHRDSSRYRQELTSDEAVRGYFSFLYRAMPIGYQDYHTQGHTLFELLTTNPQFTPDRPPAYHLNQAFRTAGDLFEVFDSNNVSVLVPYQEGAEIVQQLADESLSHDFTRTRKLLEKAKPYTVSVPETQIQRMMKSGMIYTLLDESICILNDGYYDEQTGLKEGNNLCSTLIL